MNSQKFPLLTLLNKHTRNRKRDLQGVEKNRSLCQFRVHWLCELIGLFHAWQLLVYSKMWLVTANHFHAAAQSCNYRHCQAGVSLQLSTAKHLLHYLSLKENSSGPSLAQIVKEKMWIGNFLLSSQSLKQLEWQQVQTMIYSLTCFVLIDCNNPFVVTITIIYIVQVHQIWAGWQKHKLVYLFAMKSLLYKVSYRDEKRGKWRKIGHWAAFDVFFIYLIGFALPLQFESYEIAEKCPTILITHFSCTCKQQNPQTVCIEDKRNSQTWIIEGLFIHINLNVYF